LKNHFKLLAIGVLIFIVYFSPFKVVIVSGNSMYPTLKNKQILLAMKTDKFNRNDLVVALIEDNYIIKRIKYVAGDEIFYFLTYDSELPILVSKEFYDNYSYNSKSEMVQKFTIENKRVYLIGDNLNLSDDSRRFGSVDVNFIKYKIIFPRF